MKHLIFVLVAIWAAFQLIDVAWSPKQPVLSRSLAQLSEPPVHHLTEPYRNAYFCMIGLTASPSTDPAKIGYEIWVEARETSGGKVFDYDKPGRLDLHIPLSLRQSFPSWDTDDPVATFRSNDSSIRSTLDRYRMLVDRYERCLGMPIEDWGFGLRAIPRYADALIAHRLYIAEGFSRSTNFGVDRLYKELIFWRTALRAATTISTKVVAQVEIQDDAKLLSRMLARPNVDKMIVGTTLQLTIPLTFTEYSLRWPVQHQVALAARRDDPVSSHEREMSDASIGETEWLLATAHLPSDALKKIEHPSGLSVLPWLFGEQTEEMYAAYYDALIKSSDTSSSRLPRLREIAGTMRRNLIETLLNPAPVEPEWDSFKYQLMETDARLRLTSLQVQLRKPSATTMVPVRLAEVGSQYFDPFTGFPMLWSPTQQKIYSVGRDRLDDGGDPSFDITASAMVASPRTASPSPVTASSRRM